MTKEKASHAKETAEADTSDGAISRDSSDSASDTKLKQRVNAASDQRVDALKLGAVVAGAIIGIGVVAFVPCLPIAISLFMPNVDTIKMMAVGTLLFCFYTLFAGILGTVLGFSSLYVHAKGTTKVRLRGFFIAATMVTTNQAAVFVGLGICAILAATYVMTHTTISTEPQSGILPKDDKSGVEFPNFTKLKAKDSTAE